MRRGRARAINVFARRPPSNGAKAGKKDSVDGTILHEIDPLKIEAPEPLDPIFGHGARFPSEHQGNFAVRLERRPYKLIH